jgi:hypothetical protein
VSASSSSKMPTWSRRATEAVIAGRLPAVR